MWNLGQEPGVRSTGRPGLFIVSIPVGCIPSILVGNVTGNAEGRCGSTSTALPYNDTEVSGCYFAAALSISTMFRKKVLFHPLVFVPR